MSKRFASIELARLYETQGYLEDALAMYKSLNDDVLKGGAEVRAAVKRIELAMLRQDQVGDAHEAIDLALKDISDMELDPPVLVADYRTERPHVETDIDDDIPVDSGDGADNLFEYTPELNGADFEQGGPASYEPGSKEENMAGLMEKWLMLMVVQRRVNLFKAIRSRV